MEGFPEENIVHDCSCCAEATRGSVLALARGMSKERADRFDGVSALLVEWLSRSACRG